jgi:hypothetical protein
MRRRLRVSVIALVCAVSWGGLLPPVTWAGPGYCDAEISLGGLHTALLPSGFGQYALCYFPTPGDGAAVLRATGLRWGVRDDPWSGGMWQGVPLDVVMDVYWAPDPANPNAAGWQYLGSVPSQGAAYVDTFPLLPAPGVYLCVMVSSGQPPEDDDVLWVSDDVLWVFELTRAP